MANKIRGEVALIAGEHRYVLLLTLGALAEIEDGLGLANLSDVGQRLKRASSGDLAVVASALLRGGGHAEMTPDAVLSLPCDLPSLIAAVGETFAAAGLSQTQAKDSMEAKEPAGPFAGTPCSRSD